MSLKAVLTSPDNRYKALIEKDQSLRTINTPYPPLIQQKSIPFNQFLTDDGTDSGSNDMGVDGSATNQDFYVKADSENDIYITEISIAVAYSASGKPYIWADGTALTNGSRLFYSNVKGEQNIAASIKNNGNFLRLGNEGIVPTSWEVRHVGGNNDYGYFINLKLNKFAPEYGIKLDRGSNQRLTMTIRDDVTAATTFNAQAIGFQRFE